MFVGCPWCTPCCPHSGGLFLFEVYSAHAVVFVLRPAQVTDGVADALQRGQILRFHMLRQFLLDGGGRPEVRAFVLRRGLEVLREQHLRRRLLLEDAVVALYLLFVLGGEPVDAARLAQFAHGLGEHLLIRDPAREVRMACHLDAEVSPRAVAGG